MLGSLDAFLSIYGWQGRAQCMTTLAFQAVFGGWSINVGDIRYPQHPRIVGADGKKRYNTTELAAHRAISAQLFVAGSVMGWYGGSVGWENWLGLPDADMNYTRLLASAKVRAQKYLTFGRLWRQPEWSTTAAAPPMMNLHDYSSTSLHWNQSCPTAEVLAECWLADDGTFAVVATNHGETQVMLDVSYYHRSSIRIWLLRIRILVYAYYLVLTYLLR